jgi:hypothetical protein
MPRSIARFTIIAGFVAAGTAGAQGTRLLRHPAVSREAIAFQYAGDLWVTGTYGRRGPTPHRDAGRRDRSSLLARRLAHRIQSHVGEQHRRLRRARGGR